MALVLGTTPPTYATVLRPQEHEVIALLALGGHLLYELVYVFVLVFLFHLFVGRPLLLNEPLFGQIKDHRPSHESTE